MMDTLNEPADQPIGYLMAGKYDHCRGGASEIISKDTPIEAIVDFGDYLAVRVKGFNYSALAVFDRRKIMSKPRVITRVFRDIPCHYQRVSWGWVDSMAGVPTYCKSVNDGGACPLIKIKHGSGPHGSSTQYKCNYTGGKAADYIKISEMHGIPVESYKVYL